MSSTPSTPPQGSTPTRNWTPRKKLIATLGVLTGLLLLLVIAWAFQWFRPSPAIQVSHDTTFVTEPMGPDGLPDLRRARMLRNGRGLAADENGAATLFQAVGKDNTDDADWPALAETVQIDPASGTGHEIDGDSLSDLDPNSLIDAEADDFSWRSPLPKPDLPAVIRSELERTQTD